ncbi:MAG: hypothetical protein QOK05_526 [Chloroflexota bacterium]|nr:hypothetical protein [Chloroflexota bacterium]
MHSPKRSAYPSLAPMHTQTWRVESQASYILALAERVNVHPSRLLTVGIFEGSRGTESEFYLRAKFNVGGGQEEFITRRLEALTGRSDIRLTTLYGRGIVVPVYRLTRPTRAWCPLCLDDAQSSGRVYEHLLWSLTFVRCCPTHNVCLENRCPDCGRAVPYVSWKGRPGQCPKCFAWLGSGGRILDSPAPTEWEAWLAIQGVDLIEGAVARPALVQARVQWLVTYVCETLFQGSRKAFAKSSPFSPGQVSEWLSGRRVPSLESLLRLTRLSGLTLSQALWAEAIDPVLQLEMFPKPAARPRHTFPRQQILDRLQQYLAEANQPTLSQFAALCNTDRRLIHKHLPLVRLSVERARRAALLSQSHSTWKREVAELMDAVDDLLAVGVYPSRRLVAERLTSPGRLRDPALISVWKSLLLDRGVTPVGVRRHTPTPMASAAHEPVTRVLAAR